MRKRSSSGNAWFSQIPAIVIAFRYVWAFSAPRYYCGIMYCKLKLIISKHLPTSCTAAKPPSPQSILSSKMQNLNNNVVQVLRGISAPWH
jgi:hypothetical protein